ncbi:PfkB family carbohydrate kinase [Halorhabdus rudnickae]|uniref:PfkB family carbohydrate kinase n=1 Tax=Halorhabdus rudnickae TaxID=1775544 RepID=UPI0010824443|nr:PfkB family carbohydrate kinase [Halorhabdus rudnickae]
MPTATRRDGARGVHCLLGEKGANQAIAAALSDAAVELIGAVGDDRFGEELLP